MQPMYKPHHSGSLLIGFHSVGSSLSKFWGWMGRQLPPIIFSLSASTSLRSAEIKRLWNSKQNWGWICTRSQGSTE